MPAEKKEDENKEPELIPVGDGADEAPEPTDEKPAKAEASDERVGHEEESEEEGPEGETSDQKRERRRGERQRRRQKDAILRKEVNFLRQRNEALERKFSQTAARLDQQEDLTIDGRINGLDSQIRQAESIHAAAVEASDGKTASEALRIKDELIDQKRKLADTKETRKSERTPDPAEKPNGEGPPLPRPEVVAEARGWYNRNKGWFDPTLQDDTSAAAKLIEDRLAKSQEYDPGTPEYWEELDKRLGKAFPHLKKAKKKVNNPQEVDWGDDDDADEEEDGQEEERPAKREAPESKPKKKNGG